MSSTRSALVLLNGSPPEESLLHSIWNQTDFKIFADGAADSLIGSSYFPDLILGDLDSIHPASLEYHKDTEILLLSDQNTTDAEKSLLYCIKEGFQTVHFLGSQGKRTDHGLYNLALLGRPEYAELDIIIWTETEKIFAIREKTTLHGQIQQSISIFSIFSPVNSVTSTGLEYSLHNTAMSFDGLSSISNRFAKNTVTIDPGEGQLLIALERISD